jgi:hypothetical protein
MWLEMLVTKLTTRFRLQTYLGAINMEYGTFKHSRICIRLVIGDKVAYVMSIGFRQYQFKIIIVNWILIKGILLISSYFYFSTWENFPPIVPKP